jgi:hypothetical protein
MHKFQLVPIKSSFGTSTGPSFAATHTTMPSIFLPRPQLGAFAVEEAEGITDLLILVTNVAYSCYNSNTQLHTKM